MKIMDYKSQINELYFMLFNETPDSNNMESLLKKIHNNDNSIDYLENYLRNSDSFKILSKTLEIELEISELYYILLNRKPDTEGLTFFKNEIIQHDKSLNWVSTTLKNSDEYKSKIS